MCSGSFFKVGTGQADHFSYYHIDCHTVRIQLSIFTPSFCRQNHSNPSLQYDSARGDWIHSFKQWTIKSTLCLRELPDTHQRRVWDKCIIFQSGRTASKCSTTSAIVSHLSYHTYPRSANASTLAHKKYVKFFRPKQSVTLSRGKLFTQKISLPITVSVWQRM